MRQQLFFTLAVPLFWALVGQSCFSQTSLFDKYHFDDGGYAMIGIFADHKDHPLQKKIGEFYTDDISVLNAIKKAWVFKKPQHMHACGYHYDIIVVKDGEKLDSFALNLECNELVSPNSSLYFDLKKLEMFASKFKHLQMKEREFSTVTQARLFLEELKKDKEYVYSWPPQWLNHEGSFQFNIKCPADIGEDCWMIKNEGLLLARLREAITKKYPGETFDIRVNGGMTGGVAFVEVKCNRSLQQKFDIYDRGDKTGFGKWEPFELLLTYYLKST
ncbi:MAG: hypothetical protein HS105_13030 [Chloracidobacterium sp.]|nr:hypothetical protein [Chloracidobacterium sp.]MCO5333334.1 hypothetical protein [Pyrinomonadaceae bacterium]